MEKQTKKRLEEISRKCPGCARASIQEPMQAAGALVKQGRGAIVSDALGSYTGTPTDGGEPEQDADDL